MAAARKQINRGNKPDALVYAEFMRGLLDGSLHPIALIETTAPDGTQNIHVPQFDGLGNPLPDVVVVVPKTKLVKLEYDE